MLCLLTGRVAGARRQVMSAVAEQQQWPVGWVFDGVKNMYAPDRFLPQHETHYEVGPVLHVLLNSACIPLYSSWGKIKQNISS